MPRRLLWTGIPLHRQQGLLSLRMVQVEQYLQNRLQGGGNTHMGLLGLQDVCW